MSLFTELKRRNVIRVGLAYLVASWLLIEAATVALEGFGAPEWVPKVVALILALGLPIALFFAWAYEITPEGVRPESEVDRSESITPHTARRLDLMTMAMLVLVVGLVVGERFLSGSAPPTSPTGSAGYSTASGPVSIAVLPFTNMSDDTGNEYFADGISEEILNLLADVRDLEVASRTSAFAFKGTKASITDIANDLGVRYVLEGSVRKAGEQVRVTAQLIDAGNDRHLWSETYDRTLDDIFAIQDDIAGAIGEALRVELLSAGGERVTSETMDPELYADFLEARHLLRKRNASSIESALTKLVRVVDAEPDFARGQVVLAEAYLLAWLDARIIPESLGAVQARIHAERGLELDPELSGSYLALGLLQETRDRNMAEAYRLFTKAMELEPEEPRAYHWRAILLADGGYLQRARADLEKGLSLEPDNANVNGEYATALWVHGDAEGARYRFSRQADLGNPRSAGLERALMELWLGDTEAARASFASVRDLEELSTQRLMDRAFAVAEGESDLDDLMALAPVAADRDTSTFLWALLALGEEDALLEYCRTHAISGPDQTHQLWTERHRAMRSDPRFVPLYEGWGFTDLWRELGPPPDCRPEGETFSCGHGSGL